MSKYQKHIVISAIIGLIGIPIFVLDFNSLAWSINRDIYWGMIALVSLIVGVYLFYLADKKDRENP